MGKELRITDVNKNVRQYLVFMHLANVIRPGADSGAEAVNAGL